MVTLGFECCLIRAITLAGEEMDLLLRAIDRVAARLNMVAANRVYQRNGTLMPSMRPLQCMYGLTLEIENKSDRVMSR